MGGRRPHLGLSPELCNQCGACLDACREGALKIGPGYIFVDWETCGPCTACAQACDRGAIDVKSTSVSPRQEGAVTVIPRRVSASASPVPLASKRVLGARSSVEWSMSEIGAVVATAIALLVVKDAILTSHAARSLTVHGLVVLRAAAQTVNYGVLLSVLVWLARRHGIGFRVAFGLVRPARLLNAAAWVVAGLFTVRLVATMYGAVAQVVGWDPPARAGGDLTVWFGADVLGLALAMLTVVVLGPFVEELVFRGMLLPALGQHVRPRLAIGLSALLFALSHLTLWSFVPLALLGVALGWLVTAKGSVWPAFALHGLYNLVAVLAAFYVAGTVGG